MEQKQIAKAPMSVRVTEKTMPLTKWFAEQYFQTHALMSKDAKGNVIESASEHYPIPDKIVKIRKCWDVLDKSASRNYFGEEPIPFVVDSIEKGN